VRARSQPGTPLPGAGMPPGLPPVHRQPQRGMWEGLWEGEWGCPVQRKGEGGRAEGL